MSEADGCKLEAGDASGQFSTSERAGSYVCDHDEADEEAEDADGEKQDFTPMADMEEGRVQVWDRSGESFQTYKLKRRQSKSIGKFLHPHMNFDWQWDFIESDVDYKVVTVASRY